MPPPPAPAFPCPLSLVYQNLGNEEQMGESRTLVQETVRGFKVTLQMHLGPDNIGNHKYPG